MGKTDYIMLFNYSEEVIEKFKRILKERAIEFTHETQFIERGTEDEMTPEQMQQMAGFFDRNMGYEEAVKAAEEANNNWQPFRQEWFYFEEEIDETLLCDEIIRKLHEC